MEEFSKVSDIINNEVFNSNVYASSIKKAVAFGFWKNVCGSRFSDFSIPYDIKGSTLFVAVKNPQVMQELIFCKQKLVSKINDYFLPLNIKINDLKFDYKVWNKVTSSVELEGEDADFYSIKEVENVSLNESESRQLKGATDAIMNLSFLDESLRSKCTKNIINSMKARKLRAEEVI